MKILILLRTSSRNIIRQRVGETPFSKLYTPYDIILSEINGKGTVIIEEDNNQLTEIYQILAVE